MGTVVIELEGELEFIEQEGGHVESTIDVGKDSLSFVIEKRLNLPEDFIGGKLGHCKLRLEIERP